MKILRYILSLLIGIYLWNALDQIYWTTGLKSQELQLNINARLAITPLQLERKIVSPIEYILKDFSNVKNFSSFISDQYARIIIQLKPKTDVDKFKIQVNEKFRQNWAVWKLTIKYPTWQKEMNSNRQKVSYAGIPLNGNSITKEEFQKILYQVTPYLSVDQYTPFEHREANILLSKSKLTTLQMKLVDIKNQLAREFQKIPPIDKLFQTKITNPNFITETLYNLKKGNVTYNHPDLWIQGQPAYRIELSHKKTLKQLLHNRTLSRLSLLEKIKLYTFDTSPQPAIKIFRLGLFILLCLPLVLLPFCKSEFLLLLLFMQFSLFASLIYFSQPLSIYQLSLFLSVMLWSLTHRLTDSKISILWGFVFLLGCLILFNYWVATDFNISLFTTVLISWALMIGTFDRWFKKEKKLKSTYSKEAKYFWLTLSFLGLVLGILWNIDKNNFFNQSEVATTKHHNTGIQLGVTFINGEDQFDFIQKLLTLLEQLQRLSEIRSIRLDNGMPDGLTVSIELNDKALNSSNALIRNELEKFMLSHPNQTFVLEGLGKELAQSSSIINRGVHLTLKGIHYPELIKQALTIQNNLKKNRRVTGTYLGLIPGPTIETSHRNILIKTSATNKAMIGWLLDQQMPQKTLLEFEDYQINCSVSAHSNHQWTNLLQTSFYMDEKLLKNPLEESTIESFKQQPLVFKRNGIFELLIGFNFLGSKKQADSFLRQKQKEINRNLPFGLTLHLSNSKKETSCSKLVGAILILAGFIYIIEQNHLLIGAGIFIIFLLTFFIGHWLFVAIPSTFSTIPFIPLLSYWIFSICQIYGAILFKSK